MKIDYRIENDLSIDEFKDVLNNSTLGERRPVDELERLSKMVEFGNLIITARDKEKLVGISRSLTDHIYCTYLSDLAVIEEYQHQGIGKELIRQTKLHTPKAKLILLSAPDAIHFYPKIGMKKHDNCYYLDDINEIK